MPQTALKIDVVKQPELTFAFVVKCIHADHIGEFVGGAIARVAEFAGRHGGPLGPPMTISSAPDEEGAVVLEVGWPVVPGTHADPPVEVQVLPATRAAVYRHVGEYEELGRVYSELSVALRDAGLSPVSSPRERYLTTPASGDTPITEIIWPVA